MPKLKQHLLPRILSRLQSLRDNSMDYSNFPLPPNDNADPNSVLFKHDRMYQHNLARINYTAYDVRRLQDVIHASTSHHNVMVMADSDDDTCPSHPYRYARVLGIYHVNVVYVGPGMLNYQPHRLEFLWVRWYQAPDNVSTGWNNRKLDSVRFHFMNDDQAFGFLDPSDVLRGCHVVPAFAKGVVHADGKGLSRCADDSSDWVSYYVNR
jgi:hypothetical protein